MFGWFLPSSDACDMKIIESIIGSETNNGLTQDTTVMNLYEDLKNDIKFSHERKKHQNCFRALITFIRIKRMEGIMRVIETNYLDSVK